MSLQEDNFVGLNVYLSFVSIVFREWRLAVYKVVCVCLNSDHSIVYSSIYLTIVWSIIFRSWWVFFCISQIVFAIPQQLQLPINLAIGTTYSFENYDEKMYQIYYLNDTYVKVITLIFADCRLSLIGYCSIPFMRSFFCFVPAVDCCWCSFSALWLIRVLNFNLLLICYCYSKHICISIIRKWFIKEPFYRCTVLYYL